ncbi:MAG: patatin-like phospholipase family protein [Pseudomonadales bacterium]|nr:patatin-like phospholipase family protein [Pseudomonadales bacterium]
MSSSYFVNRDVVTVKCPQRELPKNPKVALVAEGGGQRGIFTSGVLDYFIEQDFNPFDVLVGTSAGAQNLTSFLLQQPGFAKKAITELTTHDQFFQPRQAFAGEGGLNLDWYFAHLNQGEFRLPLYDLSDKLAKQDFVIVASDKTRLTSVTLNPNSANLVRYLKSSSAIPYFYKPDNDEDSHLVDGGLTAPIPIQQALDLAANIIVVIRTAPSQGRGDQLWGWRRKMAESVWGRVEKSLRDKKPKYNEMIDMMNHHEKVYNETLSLIAAPPEGVIIIELAPVDTLSSRMIGSSEKSLDEDYILGRETAVMFLQNFKHWLHEKSDDQTRTQALIDA